MTPAGAADTSERLRALARTEPGLEPAARAVLAARWAERARHELATSLAFVEVGRALAECGAEGEQCATARFAVNEEKLHAELCALIAEHYAGTTLPAPRAEPAQPARFDGASPREASLLYVVMHCAIGESIASAYLGRCLETAGTELTHEALRMMLADEVRHARLGFAFLARTSAQGRELVQRALPSLLRAVLEFWVDERGYPDAIPAGHGCLDRRELRAAVREGLEELVLPGLELVGVGTRAGRDGLERSGYFGRR